MFVNPLMMFMSGTHLLPRVYLYINFLFGYKVVKFKGTTHDLIHLYGNMVAIVALANPLSCQV